MPFKVLFEVYEAGKQGVNTRTEDRKYAYLQYHQLFAKNPLTRMVHTVTPIEPLSGPEKFVWLTYQVMNAIRVYFDNRFSLPKEEADILRDKSLALEKQLDMRLTEGRFYLQGHPKAQTDKAALDFFCLVETWRETWKEYFRYKKLKNKDPNMEKQLRNLCFDYERNIKQYIQKTDWTMNEVVYVRWYKEVVEGHIVNEHDMMGMVAVSIPLMGSKATALYHPSHVYKTVQDACGSYPKHFPTPSEIVHPEPSVAVIPAATPVASASGIPADDDYRALQRFKHDHWDHERNMLQLDYWPEFDRMYHVYQRKRQRKSVIPATAPAIVPPAPPSHSCEASPAKPKRKITVTQLSLF